MNDPLVKILLMVLAFAAGRWTANGPRPKTLVFMHSEPWTCPSCKRTFEGGKMPAFVEDGTVVGQEICIDCSH